MIYSVEHVAWQHPEPVGAAAWYGRHLGFTVARKIDHPPHTHFLADAAGRVVIEIYNNPRAPLLDYRSLDPLQLHLAFTVVDPVAARDELLGAGATVADDLQTLANGDRLVMLRDPWGFCLQLVARAAPLL